MIRYALRLMGTRVFGSPVLFVLTVAGVALGVASVVTVQLLNLNAIAAFEGTLEATTGGADLIVRPTGRALEPSALATILGTAGVRHATAIHRVNVRVGGGDTDVGRHIPVLGLDLMGGGARAQTEGDEPLEYEALLTRPGIVLPESLATELRLQEGDVLELQYGTASHTVRVVGVLPGAKGTTTAVMDIAWTDAFFGAGPTEVSVQLVESESSDEVSTALLGSLGDGVRVTTPTQEGLEARGLLSAFRLNLTALSLISVFVGAFLVYGTTRATLVRRRGEFGVLRSLGASRGQVLGLILIEIAFLGLVGVAVGLPLGFFAAQANVDAVSGTLTNLYLLDAIERLAIPSWLWMLAVLVGLGSALVGGVIPAIETTSRRIRDLLSSAPTYGAEYLAPGRLAAAGGLALVVAFLTVLLTDWIHRGLVAAFLLVAALPLAAAWVVEASARPLRPKRLGIAYALSSLSHRLTSAGVAVAGLAIAVTMMVGITVMVWSFRSSLSDWIDATVRADIYVSAAAWRGDRDAPGMNSAFVDTLAGLDGVAVIDRVRGFSGRAADRSVALRGVDMGLPGSLGRFQVLRSAAGEPDGGESVFISEPLARKTGLSLGDSIPLDTPGGKVFPRVAAVLRDYGSERGAVTMDLGQMARWFGAGDVHGAALYLEPQADLETVIARVDEIAAPFGLAVRPNRFLRTNALEVFDQTFRVTLILQGMALVVATVGVMLTLLVLGYDEAGVLALYRALGATRRQVFGFFVAKGLAIALIGTALGLAAGGGLAAILIFVTNPSYFGWSLDPHVPGLQILRQVGWIMGVAALASLYPALMASRPRARALNPIEA